MVGAIDEHIQNASKCNVDITKKNLNEKHILAHPMANTALAPSRPSEAAYMCQEKYIIISSDNG